MDKNSVEILSDFLVNLAAGWIGAAIIFPIRIEEKKVKLILLTVNILCGIMCLIAAYFIKKYI